MINHNRKADIDDVAEELYRLFCKSEMPFKLREDVYSAMERLGYVIIDKDELEDLEEQAEDSNNHENCYPYDDLPGECPECGAEIEY